MTAYGVHGPASGFVLVRYQFAGGVLLLLGMLALMLIGAPGYVGSVKVLVTTSLYSISAMGFGCALLRSVVRYPGVEASAYIIPSFMISYGCLLTFLILTRLPYSRTLLFASFLATIVWLIVVHALARRRRVMEIGIVPGGEHQTLLAIEGVRWVELHNSAQDLNGLHAIVADLRVDIPPEWGRALADCALAGIPVYHTKHLAESLTGRVQLEHLSENNFGTLAPISAFMTLKHILDWILAAAVGVLLAPLLLLLAIAIRLDSPGPAIFRQTRVGYRGHPFTVYKFRTMILSKAGTSTLEAAKTQSEDQRVTRTGAFLRRSRIDELPQIANILKGQMSWIGPRPEAQVLSQWYEGEIPFYRYRHIVRPGLTGWAQVNQGHVAELDDVRTKLNYDFYYIKTYSPWIDLLIVAKTIRTILSGFGSK
jgi:lipopolysaccharide/colanic/teichoic acid biosynthesis glycosyltransferase